VKELEKLQDVLKKFSKNQLTIGNSNILVSCLGWSLHFNLEFSVVLRANLPGFFILLHLIGVIFGSLLGLKFINKWDHYKAFLFINITMVLSFIGMVLITQPWFGALGLFIAGICIGGGCGLTSEQATRVKDFPKFGGRLTSLTFIMVSIFIIIEALLIFYSIILLQVIIFVIILVLFFVFQSKGKDYSIIPEQKLLSFKKYVQKKENIPNLALGFFYGFFMTSNYYAAFLIFNNLGLTDKFPLFVIVFWATFGILAFPVGLMMDKFGRKIITLIGFGFQAFGFLILWFIGINDINLIVIFPIFLGIGVSMSLMGEIILFGEIPRKNQVRDTFYIFFIFIGIGCSLGVLLCELLKSVFIIEPEYLAIVLLFIFLIASVILSQLKETLPSKEELEWKNSLLHIYVISKTGLPIYDQDLSELRLNQQKPDETLLSGALVAISALLKEISSKKSPLKVVRQEGFSILIEEGEKVLVAFISTQELKIIRKKIQDFLEDFEILFEDLLNLEIANINAFLPAKTIVRKYFA